MGLKAFLNAPLLSQNNVIAPVVTW